MTTYNSSDDEYSDDPNTIIQFDKYAINAINAINAFNGYSDNECSDEQLEIYNGDNIYFIYKDLTNFCKDRGLFLLDNLDSQKFCDFLSEMCFAD